MSRRVLILGGYGNFGKRIASALVRKNIPVIVAGRNRAKAEALARTLPAGLGEAACCDVSQPLDETLAALKPEVAVNTCGPFQLRDYAVAEACIRTGTHYVDLADGREFVTGITGLNDAAVTAGVAVISGASTVPGLSSSVLDHFAGEFSEIRSLKFGISPGQKAERGLATTESIMGYVGKPLKPFPGHKTTVYGWQDVYRQDYPELGRRWMANCDIPDLDLLPAHYNIREIQFSAGLELAPLHLGLWGLSWAIRAGLPVDLRRYAAPLLQASNWFNRFGSADGGMHMIISGKGRDGRPHTRRWFIIARDGDGPHIPTIPAIVLAERFVRGSSAIAGALPCVGLIDLPAYLKELSAYKVTTYSD